MFDILLSRLPILIKLWNWIKKIKEIFFNKKEKNMPQGNSQETNLNFIGHVSGDFNYSPQQKITNIHNHRPKEKYPEGTIGADIYAHGYITYLAQKAAEAQNKSGIKASPQKFYTQFQRIHGLTPLFSRIDKIEVAILFFQTIIDKTRFARGLKHKFYHSFEEHKQMIDNPAGKKGLHD